MTYKISSSVHVVGYTFRGEKKGAMIVVIDDHNASIAAIYPSKNWGNRSKRVWLKSQVGTVFVTLDVQPVCPVEYIDIQFTMTRV